MCSTSQINLILYRLLQIYPSDEADRDISAFSGASINGKKQFSQGASWAISFKSSVAKPQNKKHNVLIHYQVTLDKTYPETHAHRVIESLGNLTLDVNTGLSPAYLRATTRSDR